MFYGLAVKSTYYNLVVWSNTTHRKRLPGLLYSELATRPNSIGTWVGATDVISHAKCGNDHLNEYNITDGQILPCFTGMAYCL